MDPCGPVYILVGDGGNVEGLDIVHADEPGNCPEPSTTPDMGGSCAFNFTSGPASGKFCWDRQPDYSAYRESSFGHGILEVLISLSIALTTFWILNALNQYFFPLLPEIEHKEFQSQLCKNESLQIFYFQPPVEVSNTFNIKLHSAKL